MINKTFTFVTSNKEKIASAKRHLDSLGVDFTTRNLDMKEIQSDSTEEVALEKAKLAFEEIRTPVVISDHGWKIPSLNGFPGVFMKYAKKWFSIQDFVKMMNGKADRSIIKQEVICFYDGIESKIFSCEMVGKFIDLETVDLNGITDLMQIVSLRNSGKTVWDCNLENIDQSDRYDLWEKFSEWYQN